MNFTSPDARSFCVFTDLSFLFDLKVGSEFG